MRYRYILALGLMGTALTLSAPASAGEFTDLLDAADDFDDLIENTYDPFDFNLEAKLRLEFESATISREAACVPSESALIGSAAQNNPRLVVDPNRCSEPRIISNKELDFGRQTTAVDIDLRAGIYKDLEFRLSVPYIISSTSKMSYAAGVTPSNSSIDPSDEVVGSSARQFVSTESASQHLDRLTTFSGHRFFDVNDTEYERAGFGDPTISLEWAPFNDERDDTKATLLFGMAYKMPISPVKAAGNDNVGGGMHELSWKIASSKKFSWIEPYFGLQYFLPLSATDSPIQRVDKNNNGQVFATAPQRGDITVGTEFIPHENPETGARYGVDLRFTFGYTSEGRDYTQLFDHMTNSNCNGKSMEDVLPQFDSNGQLTNLDDVACSWIVRQPSNASPDPIYTLDEALGTTSPWNTDGIMTVESYASFTGMLGLYLQPTRYFQIKGQVSLTHNQEHFLSNARTGRDADDALEQTPDDTVDLEGADARIEKNPVFNPTYDQTGTRFRIQENNIWSLFVTAAFQF
jgi:hypothetical protein